MFEQIYQVRGAIEGLAAQLACMNGTELSALDQACDRMSQAADKGDMRSVLQHDFDFHAALLTASGNRLLDEIGLKLLNPLFAFMKIQVVNTGQGPEAWMHDLENHRLIVQIMRKGNPGLAAQFVQQCMGSFAYAAYGVWKNQKGSVHEHRRGGRRIGSAFRRT
jgi:DNA-binding GntR family transcriptional regulator